MRKTARREYHNASSQCASTSLVPPLSVAGLGRGEENIVGGANLMVLMIDGDDSGFPNLALMKLSAYHKARGDVVFLNEAKTTVDKIYASCCFTWNREALVSRLKSIRAMFPGVEVEVGGYALANDSKLPEEIEYIMPDYGLYPGIDYSLGFTSRGCVRKCPFCIVWRVEGDIHPVSDIFQFWDRRHRKIKLLDNNLLASPKCNEILKALIAEGLEVDFNQGLDIRLVDDEKAGLLSQVKLIDSLRFALDSPNISPAFRTGIETLKRNGVKLSHIMVYVLIGFDTTFEEDMERFKLLGEYGLNAFPMIFRDRGGTHECSRRGTRRY